MKELSTNCLKIKWRRDIYNRKQIIKENNTNIVECVSMVYEDDNVFNKYIIRNIFIRFRINPIEELIFLKGQIKVFKLLAIVNIMMISLF